MKQQAMRNIARPDQNRQVHIDVPITTATPESLAIMRIVEETGFVQEVIASEEEDCWNVGWPAMIQASKSRSTLHDGYNIKHSLGENDANAKSHL